MGIAASLWLFFFTTWLASLMVAAPTVLAPVLLFLPWLKERYPQFVIDVQDRIASSLSHRRATWIIGFLALVELVLGFGFLGGIQIESKEKENWRLTINPPRAGAGDPTVVPANPFRDWVFTTWVSPRTYTFQPEGYPLLEYHLPPLSRLDVSLPVVQRPVVLLRTGERLFVLLGNGGKLQVALDGTVKETERYKGEPVWVGCDKSVKIPDELKKVWTTKRISSGLLDPTVLSPDRLTAGQKLLVVVYLQSPDPAIPPVVVEVRPGKLENFPQEVVLDVAP